MAVSSSSSAPTASYSAEQWAINDPIIQLRIWGTDRAFPLGNDERSTIGTGEDCKIMLHDDTRRVSRDHADLERVSERWAIFDRSKNGLFLDGARIDRAVLTPGVEIGLGGRVTLVAESTGLMAVRRSLSRMLGWSAAQAEAVDLALRAVRLTAQGRAILFVCGDDAPSLAEELHRLTLTPERPFVLCNPRRRTGESAWNPTRIASSGLAALRDAPGGTVCLAAKHLPTDLKAMLPELRRPECRTQLVICSESEGDAELFNAAPVFIPTLRSRKHELERIVREYAVDAAARFELPPVWLSAADLVWIQGSMKTLPEIERATTLLAAVEKAGNFSAAAKMIGVGHKTMFNWFRSKDYPERALQREH